MRLYDKNICRLNLPNSERLRLTGGDVSEIILNMARTTVSVEVPNSNPDDMIVLGETALAEHDRLEKEKTGSSELPPKLVEKLRPLLPELKSKRKEAARLIALGQAMNQEVATKLGIAEGQNSRTPETLLNWLTGLRDTLQGQHLGSEQALEAYGFKVTIGTAAGRKTKAAKPQ